MPLVNLELKCVLACPWQYLDVVYRRFWSYIIDRIFLQQKKGNKLCSHIRLNVFQYLGETCSCSTTLDFTVLCQKSKMNYLFECFVSLIHRSEYWLLIVFKPASQSCEPVSQAVRPDLFSPFCLCMCVSKPTGFNCITIILLHYLEGMCKTTAGSCAIMKIF